MADQHNHTHNHHHHNDVSLKKLYFAAFILLVVAIAEVVGGIVSNSLALLSDAGHMLTDIFAIIIAIFAAIISRKEADDKSTYGYYRAEIIAAFINGIILALLTLWIMYEAVVRFFAPTPVNGVVMLAIGFIGLIANVLGAWLLHSSDEHDINTRAAFLHVLGDLFSSVAVVAGALAIMFFKWYWLDPVLSVIIAVVIMRASFMLIRQAVDILMEQVPHHVDMDKVKEDIMKVKGVNNVHHIHLWTIGSYRYSMSAHIDVDNIAICDGAVIIDEINHMLSHEYHIEHTTIQLECLSCSDIRSGSHSHD